MNLNINFQSILGYTLPYLPYFESILKQAFPGFEMFRATPEERDIYRIKFRKPGDDRLLFEIADGNCWRGDEILDTGYGKWLRVKSPDILFFDRYRINQTRLKDVTELKFNLVDFDPLETSIECSFDIGKGIEGIFYFDPPIGYSGSIKSMNQAQIENCLLAAAVLVMGSISDRPKKSISEQEGTELYEKMLLEHKDKPLGSKEQQYVGPKISPFDEQVRNPKKKPPRSETQFYTGPGVSPIDEILKKSFDFRKGINAYLRLANIAVHTGVKTRVKQALSQALGECGTDYPGPEELFHAVMYAMPSDTPSAWPIFSVDWKSTIKEDLDYFVRDQLGKLLGSTDFPVIDEIPDNCALIDYAHVKKYAKLIEGCGYDLYWGGLGQSDSYEFMLASVKNRRKMKLFIRESRCEMSLVSEVKLNTQLNG